MEPDLKAALELLEVHRESFRRAVAYASLTGHTVPSDTKSWSEILVSLLTGIPGRERKKGSDLDDGSDVKAANLWEAIDTPRFNGVLPAGRSTKAAARPEDVTALDGIPYLFFVLWDHGEMSGLPRCRVWVVRPPHDPVFRTMAARWYEAKRAGAIISNNFQLHPPRDRDSNEIRNSYGNLEYPLFFCAERPDDGYRVEVHERETLASGVCRGG